jgi:YidC/Oxa1 family membrane protein insertase
MKLAQASKFFLLAGVCDAFAPARFGARRSTAKSLAFDPSVMQEIPNHVQSLQEAFASITLSDAMAAIPDASMLMDSVQQAAPAAADVVDAAAEAGSDNGWFGILTVPIESLLQIIHATLVSAGLTKDAWGVSIIGMTILIKLLTFPLTKTQLEGTQKMQALQPAVKEVQAKYQSNPEVMNQKISELYQTNDVNPLAGCLPSIAQIPIFIGLYRAVLELAKENKLDEPFLFLPNLEGPVYGADPTQGSAWLFDNWTDGVPSLGWDDTAAFLILPVFLVISQFISMELMSPKVEGQEAPQGNVILKFLPLMIGWFSLNVPAALCLYWVTNNIVTTATSVIIRNSAPKMEPVAAGAVAPPDPLSTVFTPPPMREKPAGFSGSVSQDGLKPITSTAIDAVVIEDVEVSEEVESAPVQPKKKRGEKKKKRRKNN